MQRMAQQAGDPWNKTIIQAAVKLLLDKDVETIDIVFHQGSETLNREQAMEILKGYSITTLLNYLAERQREFINFMLTQIKTLEDEKLFIVSLRGELQK